MKLKHLLLGALMAGTATMSAATFSWTPTNVSPNPEATVTSITSFYGGASNVSFFCAEPGAEVTDVMPMWIDEDDNVITATEGERDFFDPKFSYYFNADDFEINGEYMLVLPQGLLVNANGEESEEKTLFFTFEVESLNAGMFPDFDVLDITPDFSKAQGLWNEQEIIINTNHNSAIGYTRLVVTDLNPEDPDEAFVLESTNFAADRKMGNADPIQWTVANPGAPYKFYQGHTYKAVFTLYNGEAERTADGNPTPIVDKLTYNFTGLVKPYEYSKETLDSVAPATWDIVLTEPSQGVFTYTFSGPVNVYRAAVPMGPLGESVIWPERITSNEDMTVWTVDASDNDQLIDSNGSFTLNVYAKDLDGYQLRGNMGYEDNAHYQFTWASSIAAPKFSITPANGAQLTELTEVRVKFDNGEPFSCNYNGNAFIQTKTGTILGYLVTPAKATDVTEMVFTEWSKNPNGSNPTPISVTASGPYAVMFEQGYFIQGEDMFAKVSGPQASAFTITGTPSDARDILTPIEVTPANYSYLDSFVEAYITFGETVQIMNYDGAYMLNQQGEKVADLVIESVWDEDGATINVFPHNDITEAGTYRMVITEGTIGNVEYDQTNGEEGIYNPELVYEYRVSGTQSGDGLELMYTDPAQGVVNELSHINAYFNMEIDVRNAEAELLDGNGEFLAPVTLMYDWDDTTLLNIDLEEPVTEAGNYFIHIPAGSIVCLQDYSISNEYDLYLSYTILGEKTYGLEYAGIDPEEGEVANLSEIKLTFDEWVDIPYGNFYPGAAVYNAEGTLVADGLVEYRDTMEDIYLVFNETVTEPGAYTVLVEAGVISNWDQDLYNDTYELHYTITQTGVATMETAGNVTVCDLQGRVILRNATADQISKLQKGIYVIDGKKKTVR